MKNENIADINQAERILVSVGSSTQSENLIRRAQYYAKELNAKLYAVYVETEKSLRLPDEIKEIVKKNLEIASDLDAVVKSIKGENVEKTIVDYAKSIGATKIIIGKPSSFSFWKIFFGKHRIKNLIRESGKIDVCVFNYKEKDKKAAPQIIPDKNKWLINSIFSILTVVCATVLAYLLKESISPVSFVVVYLIGVVIISLYIRFLYALSTLALSIIAYDFFLLTPYFSFYVNNNQHIIALISLFISGLIICIFIKIKQIKSQIALYSEEQLDTLFKINSSFYKAKSVKDIIDNAIKGIQENFNMKAFLSIFYNKKLITYEPGETSLDDEQREIALWSIHRKKQAGNNTGHFSATDFRYFPLIAKDKCVGVLIVKNTDKSDFNFDEIRALTALSTIIALAVDILSKKEDKENNEQEE